MDTPAPFPEDIRPLTALRFFAAWIVVCYHVIYFIDIFSPAGLSRDGVILHGIITPFLQKGYMAVDFFFILSGFILAHVHGASINQPNAARIFYIRRLARVYPLHLIMLIAFSLLSLAGWFSFTWPPFLSNLFLVQSWGPNQLWPRSFNGPSWSVSAEWMAYLCFPYISRYIAPIKPMRAFWGGATAMIMISLANYFIFGHYASNQIVWCAFRVLPEFIFGMVLYKLCRSMPPMPEPEWILSILGLTALILINLPTPDILLLPIFAGIIAAAADITRLTTKPAFLSSTRWVFLGEISYAVYMTHYPLMILMFGMALKFHGLPEFKFFYLWLSPIFAITLIGIAALLHLRVEQPIRLSISQYLQTRFPK